VAADGILLEVLEDRCMWSLLTLEHDVEDRVQARGTGQHTPQLALGNADRVRLLAVAVEDTGDEPFPAQTARVGGATPLALTHLQFDPFAGHDGCEV
jgi:hypothetical protein